MSGVSIGGDALKEKDLLGVTLEKFKKISADALKKTNSYFQHHLLDVVRDNLKGNQCNKGHSCKISSKEELQRILDEKEGMLLKRLCSLRLKN